jgi:hypothetical protein
MSAKPTTALNFVVKKHVTLPLMKIAPNTTRYFKLTGAMHIGKDVKQPEGTAKKEPATLCHAIDLETSEEGQFIVPTVLKSELTDAYANDGYVGKSFQFTFTRPEGKRYNLVTIAEIEVSSNVAETEATPAKAKK